MGGVSRYFSEVSGLGVDLTLLTYNRNFGLPLQGKQEVTRPRFATTAQPVPGQVGRDEHGASY